MPRDYFDKSLQEIAASLKPKMVTMYKKPKSYKVATYKIDGEFQVIVHGQAKTIAVNAYGRVREGYGFLEAVRSRLLAKGARSAILLGELYAVDDKGKPLRLAELQSIAARARKGDPEADKRLRIALFDIIMLNGEDMRSQPYHERFKLLERLVGRGLVVPRAKVSQLPDWAEGIVFDLEVKYKRVATVDVAIIGVKITEAFPRKVGSLACAYALEDGCYVLAFAVSSGVMVQDLQSMLLRKVKRLAKKGELDITTISGHKYALWPPSEAFVMEIGAHEYRLSPRPIIAYERGEWVIVGQCDVPIARSPRIMRIRKDKKPVWPDVRPDQVQV